MELKIRDYRCIDQANLDLSRICLVSGFNGAGKTSVLRAVASLATGEATIGILKKEIKSIIRDGFAESVISLGGNSIEYPKGDVKTEGSPIQASSFAVGIENILDLKLIERSSILQKYLKSEVSIEDFKRSVLDAGINEGMIDPVWKAIEERGWDASHKQCAETGARLKGQWEQVTGESFGSSKMESWKPENLDPDLKKEGLEKLVRMSKEYLENAIRKQGADDVQIAKFKEQARNTDFWEAEKQTSTNAIEELSAELKKLKADRALIPNSNTGGGKETVCPCCNEKIIVTEKRDVVKPGKLTTEELKDVRLKIAGLDGSISNIETKLNKAETSLKEALKGGEETAEAIRKLNLIDDGGSDQINGLRFAVEEAEAKLKSFNDYYSAKLIGSKISNNLKMIEILKPDGVRQRKLIDCLSMFNGSFLDDICSIAKWPEIKINPDMTVSYGNRIANEKSGEISEAQEIRVKIALQVAMAQLDKSDVLVIDKADHLDTAGRGGLFRVLKMWGKPAIVAMTMPGKDKVPDIEKMGIGVSYWIENGKAEKVGA